MKVFVTGATGLIGAHTAMQLQDEGHEVRLLVRNKTFAEDYFRPLGYHFDDYVVADMLDEQAVFKGLKGCDAVVHAAAMVCLDIRQAEQTYHNNKQGIENVIGGAIKLGIKKLVYVSSVAAIFDPKADKTCVYDALPTHTDPYSKSKVACELYARKMQAAGHKVCISYPGMVIGPNDPRLSASMSGLVDFVDLVTPQTTSGLQVIDVRDIARLHLKMIEADWQALPEPEQCRYPIAGLFKAWPEMKVILNGLMVKRVNAPILPYPLLLVGGHFLDWFKKHVYPVQFPLSVESANIVCRWKQVSNDKSVALIGQPLKPAEQSLNDALVWLQDAGLIKNRLK